jgi:hypothetical protein
MDELDEVIPVAQRLVKITSILNKTVLELPTLPLRCPLANP